MIFKTAMRINRSKGNYAFYLLQKQSNLKKFFKSDTIYIKQTVNSRNVK